MTEKERVTFFETGRVVKFYKGWKKKMNESLEEHDKHCKFCKALGYGKQSKKEAKKKNENY